MTDVVDVSIIGFRTGRLRMVWFGQITQAGPDHGVHRLQLPDGSKRIHR